MQGKLRMFFLAACVACGLSQASADESFLDQEIPFPERILTFRYLDFLHDIPRVTGKKAIYPPGLVDYATKVKLKLSGCMSIEPDKGNQTTIRKYLQESQANIGLNWKYDAAQDALVFDFGWHQPGSRSGQELVDQIGKLPRLPWNTLKWDAANKRMNLDAWRQAVNELMSAPENFPHAWKICLEDAGAGELFFNTSPFLDDGTYSHILKDVDGKEHLLILNSHPPMTTKSGHGTFVYYLFSANGTWEDGGIFKMGGPYCPPTVRFEPDKNRAVIEIDFTPLKITDSATGKVTTLTSSFHPGDALQYSLEIKDGKLADSLWTNVSPAPTPLDETFGVTPLGHLGE